MRQTRQPNSEDSRRDEFLRCVEAIQPRIIAFCRHMLWNADELEDALQNSLLIAYESFEKFEGGSNFQAWMFQICVNVIHNINRRTARDAERHQDTPVEELDIVAELEREYAYDELVHHPELVMARVGDEMKSALDGLTPPERTVLLLKIIGELTCKEIAVSLGMPLGSVMGYLTRARGKLRDALSEYAQRQGILRQPIARGTADEVPKG